MERPLKILVTGNRGFVGAETEKLLQSKFHQVVGYDIMDGRNVCDLGQLDAIVGHERPDRILHLAAVARFADADANPDLAYQTNVMGTANVAAVAQKFHIPVVYASTGSVYMPIQREQMAFGQKVKLELPMKEDWPTKGNSVYGCTKAEGELLIKKVSPLAPYIILRYAHLYGKEKRMHGLIGGFVERIQRGLAPTLYGGKQSNDFTYIKDVAEANLLALTAPWDKWNQVYNIGTGEELSAKAAGEAVCDALKWPKKKIEIKEQRTVDPDRFLFDCSKAERMLGFKAKYSFAAGLKEMFEEPKPVAATGYIPHPNSGGSIGGTTVPAR